MLQGGVFHVDYIPNYNSTQLENLVNKNKNIQHKNIDRIFFHSWENWSISLWVWLIPTH